MNYLRKLVGRTFDFIIQQRSAYIVDRKYEIISIEFLFTFEKPLKLLTAVLAFKEARSDNRY